MLPPIRVNVSSNASFESNIRVVNNNELTAIENEPNESKSHHHRRRTLYDFTRNRLQNRMLRYKKCQFFTILTICTSILFFQVSQCVIKYIDSSTGTADRYVHVAQTSFPTMTICPTYPYKLERLKHHGINSKSEIQFKALWISKNILISPQNFYTDVVYKVEEIVNHVSVSLEKQIQNQNIINFYSNESFFRNDLFIVLPYYYNGDCFSLNLPENIKKSGVLEIVVDFFQKADIFIHHSGQFLSPNSRDRIDVEVGKFVKIALNHEVVQLLGHDGTCESDYTKYHQYDHCIYDQLEKLMIRKLNCTVPWLPNKSHICIKNDERKKIFEIYQNNRRNQNDICKRSCEFTNMYFGPPVTGKADRELSNIGRAVMYFRRDIKTTTEYYLYSLLSMVAEIGGNVGLLLGVSLFKLASVNNVFLDWIYNNKIADLEFDEDKKKTMKKSPLHIIFKEEFDL